MVTGNDIAPARRSDYAKISSYRKGDMLQLMFRDDASAPPVAPLVADSRCLGTLADNRSGVVIKPGVLRGGIMRNIVVAANDPSKSEPVMSLYSANEVMPFTLSPARLTYMFTPVAAGGSKKLRLLVRSRWGTWKRSRLLLRWRVDEQES